MIETTVEVRVPTPLLQLGLDEHEIQRRVNEWLVLSLFTEDRISSGKAAHLLNLTRLEFLDLLRQRGIADINDSDDKMAEEFAAVDELEVNITQ